ncbi:MAG: hypothetical protein HZA84_01000 [Thaumarchaeota archaeon]|nr:hypothetical protein [Nitrososphaerota archaeon]
MACLIVFSYATDNSASACECKDLSTRTPYLLDSDSIFLGKVKSIEKTNDEFTSYFVKFDVDKVWNGSNTKEIVIRSSLDTGMCAYPFEVNQTLVVHASKDGKILNEKGCGTLPAEYVTDYIEFLDEHVDSDDNIHVVPEILWDIHDVILDGTIVEYDSKTWAYHIKIHQVFKGSINSNLISAEGFDVVNYFKKGDRALFYIYDISPVSTNYKYKITAYSVKTSPICDARSLIQISPTLPNENPFVHGAPTIPVDWVDPCVPKYFSYDPDFFNFRESIAPLKQLKHKIPLDKIRCYDDKILLFKNSDGSPTCVKPQTVQKLVERGWAKP